MHGAPILETGRARVGARPLSPVALSSPVMRSRVLAVLTLASATFTPRAFAQAQQPPPAPQAEERPAEPPVEPPPPIDPEVRRAELFSLGRSKAAEGKWAEAAGHFREVLALRSAPRALLALAIAEQELGHLLSARALLLRASQEAVGPDLAADKARIELTLATLLPTIPRVRLVRAAGDGKVLTAHVDGKLERLVDGHFEVDPGEHEVRLRAQGFKTKRITFVAKRGEITLVQVGRLVAAESTLEEEEPVAAAPPPPPSLSRALVGPTVLGIGGLGTMALGFGLLAMGTGHQDDALATCAGRHMGCPESARYDALRGRDEIYAGDALIGVGAAALGAGVIWIIVTAASRPSTEPTKKEPTAVPTASGLALRF